MASPPPNIRHNKDSEVSNSRTNQVIYLWTSWEISNNFNDEEKKKSIEFFQKCKKEFDALFAEKIEEMKGGVFDGIFDDRMR